MTVDEVDGALAEWHSRLRRIDENLVALQLDPAHTRLEQSRDGGLDGLTRARVLPALTAMEELFDRRGLLYEMVGRATKLRARLDRRRPAAALREIEGLLHGPSIVLPPVETPLGRLSLLGTSETAVTPDQLLSAMVASFELARDAVAAVDQAWNQLDPECRRAAAEVDRLQALAAGLGEEPPPALAAARADLAAVQARIARDPLGATTALTSQVLARLRQAEGELGERRRQREEVRTGLDRAPALVVAIREAHDRAAAALDRCRREVVAEGPVPAPLDPGRIDGLAAWLATLELTAGSGRWSSAAVGVARWQTAAQAALGEAESTARATQAPLDRRDELLGRLLARRQQARALAARGQAVEAGLDGVAVRAERLLRRVPAPLAEAAALVAEYEAGVLRARMP